MNTCYFKVSTTVVLLVTSIFAGESAVDLRGVVHEFWNEAPDEPEERVKSRETLVSGGSSKQWPDGHR